MRIDQVESSTYLLSAESLFIVSAVIALTATLIAAAAFPFFFSFPQLFLFCFQAMTATITESTYISSAEYLKQRIPEHFKEARLAIICGSGLGGLVDTIEQSSKIEIPYNEIPGFVTSTGKYYTSKRYIRSLTWTYSGWSLRQVGMGLFG